MAFLTKVKDGTISGVLVSALVHVVLAGALYYGLVLRKPAPIVAELDLSMAPLVALPPNAGGGSGAKPSETWTVPKKEVAPAPVAAPVETQEEVAKLESQEAPCPDCKSEGPLVGNGWGGGTGEGEGQYIPAEQASRKPRWVKNFIRSTDYPLVARQQGKDGRVVLTILIDAEGRVRDARLLEGGYEALNEVALRKVREAVFSPAYDAAGQPVSCKVTLPIRFELK